MSSKNNEDKDLSLIHLADQLAAAAEQARETAIQGTDYMVTDAGRVPTGETIEVSDLLSSYLMEEWTWFSNLRTAPFAPDHCEHVDPSHPAMWFGILNYPNHFWCQECAADKVNEDEEVDRHKCDRCAKQGVTEFYDISFPAGNILIVGSVCRDCVDRTMAVK